MIMNKILRKLIVLCTLFIALLLTKQANATHVMGAQITYQSIDSLKFKVTVKYYRWCNGVSFSNPSSSSKIRCVSCGGGSVGLTLSLVNIKEITPVCATASGSCVPPNTYGTGEGVEEHTYSAIVDFNDPNSPFYSMRNCCKFLIETTQCCRNSSINTGGANANFYTYAEVDLTKSHTNSSPVFTTLPYAVMCCSQPFYGSFGAVDTTDGDSLSYHWGHPMSAYGTNIGYTGTHYAYNHPFKAYYPGTLTPPYNVPSANPPIGIYLDPSTGNLTLTPTRCDEVTVAVVDIKEWRKDTAGVYQQLGMVRHDMQYITTTCPDNNPPTIEGPYNYSISEGQNICFTVQSRDVNFVPPPPLLPGPPDTTTLTWNQGIPGASFILVDSTAREKAATFCWTPPIGMARTHPYRFVAEVKDDNCPLRSSSARSFSILVQEKIHADLSITAIDCGDFAVSAILYSDSTSGLTFLWQVYDTLGNKIQDSTVAHFTRIRTIPVSSQLNDTLRVFKPGRYIVELTLTDFPGTRMNVYSDTVDVENIPTVEMTMGDDTLCVNSEIGLTISSTGNPLSYEWFRNGFILPDSGVSVNDVLDEVDSAWIYKVLVTDTAGCSAFDEVRLLTFPDVASHLQDGYTSCGDSIILYRSAYTKVEWNSQAKRDTFVIPESGNYHVSYSDSLGCVYVDSFSAIYYTAPSGFLGEDTTACGSLELTILDFDSLIWADGFRNSRRTISSSGLYTLSVMDSNECWSTESVVVDIVDFPTVRLNNAEYCGPLIYGASLVSPNVSFFWSTGEGTSTVTIDSTSRISLLVTDSFGCSSIDSADIVIHKVPKAELPDDTLVCGGSVTLFAGNAKRYKWNTLDTTSSITVAISGQYWVTLTSNEGCTSSDTAQVQLSKIPKAPIINRVGDSIVSNLKGQHHWYRNDTLLAEQGDRIAITQVGTYRAVYVAANGCESMLSNVITKTLKINHLLDAMIEVSPNPTNGQLKLTYEGPGSTMDLEIKLLTLEGKEVAIQKVVNGKNVSLQWDDIPSQLLWLVVSNEHGKYQMQVLEL